MYFKPKQDQTQHETCLDEADENRRDGFAYEDFQWRQRRDKKLVECPVFPFPGNGQAGQYEYLGQSQHGNQ